MKRPKVKQSLRRRLIIGSTLISIFIVGAGIPLESHAASFSGLGYLPGGNNSSLATGVSADGSVVVGGSSSGSAFNIAKGWTTHNPTLIPAFEGYRSTASTGMQGLGDLPGGDYYSPANAVSANGSVVVGVSNTGHGIFDYEAYRWTSNTGMQGLGDLPGGTTQSRANSVSADGSVVVGWSHSSHGYGEAFRWTSNTGMQGLGDLPGGDFASEANGISADGSVIVGRASSGLGREAFRWTSSTGMEGLGDLSGGEFGSGANAISADGSVIVGSSRSAFGPEAFRWTKEGGMQGLGDLLGGDYNSGAWAVSADGSIIGGSSKSILGWEAFIWNEITGIQNLKDVLITDFGLDTELEGWHLFGVKGISEDGLTLVGNGTNPYGDSEAWIARLNAPPTTSHHTPEPSTILLLCTGLAGMIGWRMKKGVKS